MFKTALFSLAIIFCNAGSLLSQEYLLRIELPTSPDAPIKAGTTEFDVSTDTPFFVRSTLGGESQFLMRGTLQKAKDGQFVLEYFCQVAELRTDPAPPLKREGKARLTVRAKEQLVSELSDAEDKTPPKFDFKVSLGYLQPHFGKRESSSAWKVRLVDSGGAPVVGAYAALYGEVKGESEPFPIVESKTGEDGVVVFTEGRESLLTMTFYAEHKEQGLYAAANLNPDELRADDYKHYTIKMTDSLKRFRKPVNAP
jgi:hypothetical protein